jgi:hypothetical protein
MTGRWIPFLAGATALLGGFTTGCSSVPELPPRIPRAQESIVASAIEQDQIDPLEIDENWLPLSHAIAPTAPVAPPDSPGPGTDSTGATVSPPLPPTVVRPTESVSSLLRKVQAIGVPSTSAPDVVFADCYGGTRNAHWGYFNNGAAGGPVSEPGGIVVPVGSICINPNQPSMLSSLIHEMGHKWFSETGRWAATAASYGTRETAAECFAKDWGATVFGSGGCSDSDAARMRVEFGW